MIKKENDLMLNVVANPEFSLSDFKAVGLNVDNTSLQSADYYKNNPWIQEKFKKDDGRFDDKKFNEFYKSAQIGYAQMADKQKFEESQRDFKYAASNIFATSDQKNYNDLYKPIIMPNPTMQTQGTVGWKETGTKFLSDDELAQRSKVLLNPLSAGDDYSNAEWDSSPNDWGLFKYWNDTLVMAQWDEEGNHIDPITKQEVHHQKGEYKIGPDGSYYYEKLDGRDIYGKKVLNKMNIITEDGSFANKLDFLDSDDRNKSLGGTIMKNLALVGTMFIPGVGPWVTALSLVPTLTGLLGTFGKMASQSSDNSFLSELEGFGKSWELQGNVSEESQQSTWTLENFINLVGDTMAQLKQQRFFFERVPYLFTGKFAGTAKGTEAVRKGFEKEAETLYNSKLSWLQKKAENNVGEFKKYWDFAQSKNDIVALEALAKTDAFTKKYNKIGEIISKGYMTAITVGDTYGEAKHAGATDLEATLLTLGYGITEAAILNTGIGEWILPELHAERAQNRQVVKKLMQALKSEERTAASEGLSSISRLKAALNADKSNKKEWAQNVINASRDFFKGEFFTGGSKAKNIVTASIAGGLGEGVEEVSEELLADFSKGVFNTLEWLSGDNTTRLSSFGYSWNDGQRSWSGKDIVDRYGMSFLGGVVGGGLTNVGTAYNIQNNIANMSTMQAYQQVVYAARNGQLDNIRKTLNKYKPDTSDYLSAVPKEDANGNINYVAQEGQSQTDAAKKMINQIFNFVEDTLNANNINITDASFLNRQVLSEWRYQQLYNSYTAVDFLGDFNRLSTNLVKDTAKLELLERTKLDLNSNGTIEDSELRTKYEGKPNNIIDQDIKNLKDKIKKESQTLQDYIEGKKSTEFMSQAFLELTPYLNQELGIKSFHQFVQDEYKREVNQLDEVQLKEAHDRYESYRANPTTRDQIKRSAKLLIDLNKYLAPILPKMVLDVDTEEYLKTVNAVTQTLREALPTSNDSKLNLDDDQFMKVAELPNTTQKIINFLRIIDPEKFKSLRDPYTNDRQSLIDTYKTEFEALQKEYKDLEKQHDDGIDQKKQEQQQELDDLENNYNSSVQPIIDKYQKDIDEYNNKISKLNQEIQDLEQKIPTLKTRKAQVNNQQKVEAKKLELHELESKKEAEFKNIEDKKNSEIESLKTKYEENKAQLEQKHQQELNPLINTKIQELNTKNEELKQRNEKYKSDLENLFDDFINNIKDTIYENVETYMQPILDKGYLDNNLKNELDQFFVIIDDLNLNKFQDGEIFDEDFDRIENLKKSIIGDVNSKGGLPESKLDAILNQFSQLVTGQTMNYNQLIEKIHAQLNTQNITISDIKALEDVEKSISEYLRNIKILKLALKSSMTDTLSIAKGNPFGYNAILNQISEKQNNPLNLALITESETMPLIHKLDEIERKLLYMQRIYDINKGNKFQQQTRANANLIHVRNKCLSKFINTGQSDPFKGWDGWNELESKLRPIVENNTPIQQLSQEDLEKSRSEIEDAFYEFAQKNKSKLQNVDQVASLLSQFDLTNSKKQQNANENITELTDLQFVQYIFSCMAMKASDFYSLVAQQDFGDIAPIPLQIEATRATISHIMDRDLFKILTKATEKSIKDKLQNMNSDQFAEMLAINLGTTKNNPNIKKLAQDSNKARWYGTLILPKFSMISLIEGIAGSGKTQGVFRIVDKILDNVDEFKDKPRYFIHAAKEDISSIEKTSESIFGKDKVKSLLLKQLFDQFVVNYKPHTVDPATNQTQIPQGTTTVNNDGSIVTTQTIKKANDIPSVIYIDEVSLLSEFDLQLLQKWAEQEGIHIVVAGDFHQNCIQADIDYKVGNDIVQYEVVPENRQFMTSPKLGLTMRSGNSVKTSNQQKVESHLTESQDYKETVKLEYTVKNDLLYGDYHRSAFSSNDDQLLLQIQRMVNSLDTKNNERIFFIYNKKNSPLYQYLMTNYGTDKIIFKKGSQAQGDECRYSIIDIQETSEDSLLDRWKYIYTGMTRASQASIIIADVDKTNISIDSTKVSSMYSEHGYKEYLQNWTKSRFEFLKGFYSSGNPIVYNKPTQSSNYPARPNNQPSQSPTQTSTSQTPATQSSTPSQSPAQPARRRQSRRQSNNQPPATQTTSNAQSLATAASNQQQPKFKTGDKVVYNGQNYEIELIDTSVNPIKYLLKGSNGQFVSENKLTLYVPPTFDLNKELDEIVSILNNTLPIFNIDQLKNTSQNDINAIQAELIDSINKTNLNPDVLNNYQYIGIDGVSDLLKLINGDVDLLKIENDINKPHAYYLFAEKGATINSIDDIKFIVSDLWAYALTEYFNNKPNNKLEFIKIKDFANILYSWEQSNKSLTNDDQEPLSPSESSTDNLNSSSTHVPTQRKNENKIVNGKINYFNGMEFFIDFHSINTLELGAVALDDGTFDYDPKGTFTDVNGEEFSRLDGVNGLKLMSRLNLLDKKQYIKDAIDSKNTRDCLQVIADLQTIILTIDDKTELINTIAEFFSLDKDNLFINFAFKKTPTVSSLKKNPDLASGTQFHKDPRETSFDSNQKIKGSDQIASMQLVALIGHQDYGEVLEIPLLGIANPITVINYRDKNGNPIFPEALEILNDYKNTGENAVNALYKIEEEFRQSSSKDLKDLSRYCKLYLSNDYLLYRFGIQKLDDNDRIINKYKNDWVPAKMRNRGIDFQQQKGLYQYDNEQLVYDVTMTDPIDWQDLSEFTTDPRFTYSEIMQVPQSGILEDSAGNQVQVQTGHNFIIVSEDPDINAQQTKKLLEAYIKQEVNPDSVKKLKLIYIIPPEATLEEYVDYLRNSLTGQKPIHKIGFYDTPFKILNAISNNPTLFNEVLNCTPRVILGNIKIEDIENILNELNNLYQNYLNDRTQLEAYKNKLKETFLNTNRYIGNVLSDFILKAFTSYDNNQPIGNNTELMNKVQDEINKRNEELRSNKKEPFRFYYTTSLQTNSNSFFGAKLIANVNNYAYEINGTVKPFKIHGKLIPFTFTGCIPGFQFLTDMTNLNSESGSKGGYSYLVKSKMVEEKEREKEKKKNDQKTAAEVQDLQDKIDSVLSGTGISMNANDFINEQNPIESFIIAVNNTPDCNFVIYNNGSKIIRSNNNDDFKNHAIRFGRDGGDITTLKEGEQFKLFIYNLNTNEETSYDAQIENGNIKYVKSDTQKKNDNMNEYDNLMNSISDEILENNFGENEILPRDNEGNVKSEYSNLSGLSSWQLETYNQDIHNELIALRNEIGDNNVVMTLIQIEEYLKNNDNKNCQTSIRV